MTTASLPTRPSDRARSGRRAKPVLDLRNMDHEELWSLAEELNGRPVPNVRMTENEFEAWADEDIRAEWLDGEIVMMAPANFEHDDLNNWLSTMLRMYVEEHDLGIICTNVSVRITNPRRRRDPDLFFVAKHRRHLMRPTYFNGPPDLIFEIVSPDSQSRDRREKFEEYEKAGVREYWIFDPLSKTVELYRLERKRFRAVDQANGILVSSVLRRFFLKPAQLWRRPLPKVATVLRQLAAGK